MKILAISDTHGMHNQLQIKQEIDCVIHCGDSTNYKSLINNEIEFRNFIEWFINLDVKYKILVPGNHDAWATKKYNVDFVKNKGIIYLDHEYYEIEGIKIFGSPYTPIFGDWYFMKDRSKLDRYWQELKEGIDVLITHGPPKGILDLSYNRDNILEYCGDVALRNHVFRTQPKYHCFGHIHNYKDIINQGTRNVDGYNTTFINCSMVEDGKFEKGLISQGKYFEI